MSFLARFWAELVSIVLESAPYLLLGFVAAGLLKAWVPARAVVSRLGKNDFKSVFLASLYGIPIPLCSCSVLPTATALRRAGASRGATTSFLIATPETGVDSIGVTYALLDPLMTVLRPIVAFVTAVTTGVCVNLFASSEGAEPDESVPAQDCAGDHSHDDESFDAGEPHPFSVRVKHAIRYAFGPLLDDLTPWLLLGFLISGLIGAAVPEDFFGEVLPQGFLAMLLMAVVGAPLYVCATASTPIAASLIAKGLDPGAALVFLLVGPATNASTVIVVKQLLGKRVLWVYLFALVVVALLAGLATSALYRKADLDLAAVVSASLEAHDGWLSQGSAVLLVLAMLVSAARLRLDRRFLRGLAHLLRM